MARPATALYRWCTTLLNRVAPSASAKSLGFAAGDPVPAGVHNSVFGVLSDWVDWLTLRPTSLVVLAPYLPWGPAATLMAGTPVTLARTLSTLRITASAASVGRAICGLPIEGGLLTGVSFEVTGIDVTTGGAGNAVITAVLFDSDGTDVATFSGNVTATGTATLTASGTPVETQSRDGWIVLTVRPGTEIAHYIELTTITLTFAATP
jgi:hypothetical protein